jgi:hypothetical protein
VFEKSRAGEVRKDAEHRPEEGTVQQIHIAEQQRELAAAGAARRGGGMRRAAAVAALTGALLACGLGSAAASETYIKEEGHLHLARKSGGSAIVEEGSASGTFDASVQTEITIKVSRVTGSVVVHLKGGSISGNATATPHFSGKYVSFKGSLTIKHGTGRYRGASGTAGFYGALNHANYTLSVQLIGHLHM